MIYFKLLLHQNCGCKKQNLALKVVSSPHNCQIKPDCSVVRGSVALDNVENSNAVVNDCKELVLVNSTCPNMDMLGDCVDQYNVKLTDNENLPDRASCNSDLPAVVNRSADKNVSIAEGVGSWD